MPRKQITPELLAHARQLYEQTNIPNRVIADTLGIDPRTLLRHIPDWGWKRRSHPVPTISPPGAASPLETFSATTLAEDVSLPPVVVPPLAAPSPIPLSRVEVTLRMQEAVERELAAIDTIIASLKSEPRDSGDAERTARTLASLSRTLREVMRHDTATPKSEPADDANPCSVDELRRTLAEKLERLVAEQQSEGDRGP